MLAQQGRAQVVRVGIHGRVGGVGGGELGIVGAGGESGVAGGVAAQRVQGDRGRGQ